MNRRSAIRAGCMLALAIALAGVGWVVWFQPRGEEGGAGPQSDPLAGLNLDTPDDASYKTVRHVLETGGNERTRELAIVWLDRQSRRRLPLNAEQETWLLGKLAANGHASWDAEYRFLFFNSAFNVLHMGSRQEALTRQLQKLALEAPEKTMRLYALQHIALQRGIGHLTGPLADEVRGTLHHLASQAGSPVAGSALSTLISWEGRETPAEAALIGLTLQLAADPACEVDVRVTALHAAREQSLPLARRLAGDATQSVPLRKAAIARIGQHGEEDDRAFLESLRTENFRLAQAAEPALRAIQQRLSNPQAADPIPF